MQNPKHHILILGTVWPEPRSSAAGSRMMQLIDVFLEQSWKVSFATAAEKSEYMLDLISIGVGTFSIELNNSSFDVFIKDLQPSIVMFDRFMTEEQYGWRVSEACPDALRILDTEDIHCLRAARQKGWKEKRELEITDLMSDVAKREIASIYRCDISLIISVAEMQILKDIFKVNESLLHYVPFMLDPVDKNGFSLLPAYPDRNYFLSIGNFLHEPNWNAVQYLKDSIWPLVRKQLPGVELHVYGAYSSQKVEALHNEREGFLIKGRAEDAKEVMKNARVCLAPLRFGAGLKGKLVEAMQCGTPSVTTSVGAEAMHGDLPWSGAIADSPEDIANSAVQLYINEKSWHEAQLNGIEILNRLFNKSQHKIGLLSKIELVRDTLAEHRLHNFTGAMLMHHTISGTKYMSKWIEEKNRRYC